MNGFRIIGMLLSASIACIGAIAEMAPALASLPSSNLQPDIRSSAGEIGPSCRRPRALTFRLHVDNVGTLASFASADAPLVVADSERPPWVGREAMPAIPAGGSVDVSVLMPAPIRYGTHRFTITLFGIRSATFTATVEKATAHGTKASSSDASMRRGSLLGTKGAGSPMRISCDPLSK